MDQNQVNQDQKTLDQIEELDRRLYELSRGTGFQKSPGWEAMDKILYDLNRSRKTKDFSPSHKSAEMDSIADRIVKMSNENDLVLSDTAEERHYQVRVIELARKGIRNVVDCVSIKELLDIIQTYMIYNYRFRTLKETYKLFLQMVTQKVFLILEEQMSVGHTRPNTTIPPVTLLPHPQYPNKDDDMALKNSQGRKALRMLKTASIRNCSVKNCPSARITLLKQILTIIQMYGPLVWGIEIERRTLISSLNNVIIGCEQIMCSTTMENLITIIMTFYDFGTAFGFHGKNKKKIMKVMRLCAEAKIEEFCLRIVKPVNT